MFNVAKTPTFKRVTIPAKQTKWQTPAIRTKCEIPILSSKKGGFILLHFHKNEEIEAWSVHASQIHGRRRSQETVGSLTVSNDKRIVT